MKNLVGLLLATLLIVGCDHSTYLRPAPPAGSWLVLLCSSSDAPAPSHPPSYYEELFSKSQRDFLFDYFNAASLQKLDVSSTEVFGWFPMNVTAAEINSNARDNAKRHLTAQDCIASALGKMIADGFRVDTSNYAGVVTVINVGPLVPPNVGVDSGATGRKWVVVNPDDPVSFWAHEMIHEFRTPIFPHSRRAARDTTADHVWGGPEVDYQDCWDIMSWLTCTFTFGTQRGMQGPELQGAYREWLRWMPADRVTTVEANRPARTVTLAPVSEPSNSGFLLLKAVVPSEGYYVVEFRKRSGFDRAIPYDAVVIREQRNDGITRLVERQNQEIGWRAGETFTDKGNFTSIRVDSISATSATVTVNTAETFGLGPAQLGEVCGDKYRSQVRQCAPGLVCEPRRGNQIVTMDWFCLP